MRVLITGASGFVGRNLFLSLLFKPEISKFILPVRNTKKLLDQWEREGVRVSESRVQVVDCAAPDWRGLENIEVDVLVHCAGLLFAQQRKDFFTTNVEGTLTLFEKVKFGQAVVLSSQAASGPCQLGQPIKTEEDIEEPVTGYGWSKLEMERLLAERFGHRNYLCLRPPIILGARDTATLPLFRMVKSRLLFKPGLKPKYYSYIAVSDLVEGIERIVSSNQSFEHLKDKNFFVASQEVITDELLITTAAQAAKKRGVLLKVPQPILKGIVKVIDIVPAWREAIPSLSSERAQEIWPDRWVVSSQKFHQKFQWQPHRGLMETLQETHDWYVKNGDI